MSTEIGIETLPLQDQVEALSLELAESRREVSRLIDALGKIRRLALTVAEMARDGGLRGAGVALADLCSVAIEGESR